MKEKLLFYYTNSKSVLLALLMLLANNVAFSQSTVITTTAAFLNNNGSGTVTFNFQNTNGYPIKITGIAGVTGTSGAQTCDVYYNTTPLTAQPTAISTATGWNLVMSGTYTGVANTTTTTTQPFITNGSFIVPANTTYGIAVASANQRYFTMTAATTISTGGCNIIAGPGISFGGGVPPAAPTFTPRGWIGSITFEPFLRAQNDIGVNAIDSPQTFCGNTQNIVARINNYGITQVNSFTVNWSLGGVLQTPVYVNQLIDTAGGANPSSIQVALGTGNFPNGVQTQIKAWTSDPNNTTDTARINDTTTANRAPAMNGNYTVGGPVGATNFATLDAAISALNFAGVCGPVNISIAPGVYTRTTALVIGNIAGASNTNTITFDGGNRTTTRITGSIASSAIIVMNASKYITFKNLTVENFNATTPCAIAGVGATRKITLRNVIGRVPVIASGTSTTGYVFNFTGTALGAGNTGGAADSTLIDSCRAVGGGYGIIHYGNAVNTMNSGLVITNNLIDSCNGYGLYIYNNNNPVMVKFNTINMTGWNYGYMGIYAYNNQSDNVNVSHEYSNNRINGFGGYGLYIFNPHLSAAASTAAKAKVNNNVLVSWTGSSSGPVYSGIYMSSAAASRIDVLHNTVVLRGTNTTTSTAYAALYSTGSTAVTVKNNVFAVYSGNNYSASFGAAVIPNGLINYNNYHNANPAILFYRGGAAYSTATYKTASAGGDSSFNVIPSFVNLAATPYPNVAMANGCDGIGVDLSAEVPTDYLGVTRSTTTPTLGAYEFTGLVSNNLAVQRLITPVAPITAGTQDLAFEVKNIGSNIVYNYNASYKLNGNTPVTQFVIDQLNPCITDTVWFTSTNQINLGAVNNIAWFTDSPNSLADIDANNDTARVTYYSPLNGTYTVGGSNPDFATPAAAAAALANGVAGPVVFDIRPGTYGQVVVNGPIAGSNSTNTITFDGQNKASTIISGATTNAMFLVNQASYITIRDITVTNTTASAGIAIVGNSANYNGSGSKIINCNVNLPLQTGTSSSGYCIIFTGTSGGTGQSAVGVDSVLVDSCTTSGSGYSLSFNGASNAFYNRANIFRNNVFNSSNYMGVYMINAYNAQKLYFNTVNITSTTYGYYGIYFSSNQSSDAVNSHEFIGNRINGFNGYGLYITTPHLAASAGTSAPVKIYNNIIVSSVGTSSYPVYGGIYLSAATASNISVYHNNVVMQGINVTTSNTYSCIFNTGSTAITIKNNIFSVLAGNYYCAGLTNSQTGNSVNNNIYYNATSASAILLVRNATNYTSANYKTVNAGGDLSLNVTPPYVSATNFNLTNGCFRGEVNSLVPTDITGYTRNTPPNIGAYEYQGVALDLMVDAMPYPTTPITLGSQDLAVRVRNNGSNAITSFDVAYTLNNGTPVVQNWSGILASCDTTTIVFANAQQINLGATNNNIKVYISSPNFTNDGNPANDTLSVNLMPPLAGTYVLGSAPSDFTNFAALNNVLTTRGVSGPVTINVKTGTYTGQVSLDNAIGASPINTITIKSLANHVDSVILASDQLYTLRLNGSYYVINRLTVNQTHVSNSNYAVQLTSNASFDTLSACKISAPLYNASTVTAFNYTLYATGYTGNGLALINNTFLGSYYGVYLQGVSQTAPMKNPYIAGNNFTNFYYGPFYYLYYTNGAKVLNNIYTPVAGSAATMYMYHYYNDSGYQNMGNVYNGLSGKAQYYYNYYSYNTADKRGLIANNRFGGNGMTFYYYAGNTSTANFDIVHNTFNLGTGFFYWNYTAAAINPRIYNNIMNGTGTYSMNFNATPSSTVLNCDYNLVYAGTSTTPYYIGTTTYTQANYRALTGLDKNTIIYRAPFTNASFLTPIATDTAAWAINGRGVHLNVALNDVNNVARPATPAQGAPDLGAVEFTPTSVAPMATAIPATPVAGGTQVFMFAGDTVAKINYDAFANVPTDVTVRQYTGKLHPLVANTQLSTNVYNVVTANGSGSYFFTYNMYYRNSTVGNIANEDDLRGARYNNNFWNIYPYGTSTVDTAANILTIPSITEFGDFIGTDNNTPLPVSLVNFGANAAGKNALISWTTANERNSSYFEIHASVDGKNFKPLTKVKASGNSNTLKTYGYNHTGALATASTVYYRLKTVDLDGSFVWSEIVSVTEKRAVAAEVAVYPNPFNSSLSLALPANTEAQVELISIQGVSVLTQNITANQNGVVTIDGLNKLSNGVYFIKVTQNGETQVSKLVKQ